jgi:hypothetical protein
LLVGISGVIGAAAFWRRRRKNADLPAVDTGPDPAEELRSKLAESRTTDEAVADAEAAPLDPAARRQSVHDRARASIDELK